MMFQVDKFCLMRIWSQNAFIGSELARFSRRYFFSGALLAYSIISAYVWAGFPYDNVCEPIPAKNAFTGLDVTPAELATLADVNLVQDNEVQFCNQNWAGFDGLPFPPTARSQPNDLKWMTDEQETLANISGYTALASLTVFLLVFFGGTTLSYLFSWIQGVYKPSGQMQYIDFSSNPEIFGYIPQVRVGGFPFPCLCCDIDSIDQSLIGWNDPTKSYDYYNLIFDVPWKGMPRTKLIEGNTRSRTIIRNQSGYIENSQREGVTPLQEVKPIFSIVQHYPPAWKTKVD